MIIPVKIPNQLLDAESTLRTKLLACYIRGWKIKNENLYGGFSLQIAAYCLKLKPHLLNSKQMPDICLFYRLKKKVLRGYRFQWIYEPVHQFQIDEITGKATKYFLIPPSVFRLKLDITLKMALICCFYLKQNHSDRLKIKKPLKSTLIKILGVSMRSVKRIIKNLVNLGYLVKDSEGYRLTHHLEWADYFKQLHIPQIALAQTSKSQPHWVPKIEKIG
jgi:predicted transcriptional regulator